MTAKHLKKILFVVFLCGLFSYPHQVLYSQNSDNPIDLIKLAEKAESSQQTELCEKAISLAIKSKDRNKIADVYHKAGIILFNAKQKVLATKYLENALLYSDALSSPDDHGNIEEYLGWLDADDNLYVKAIEHFENAVEIFNKTGNEEMLGNSKNSLGAMHWYLRNYSASLDNFEEVLLIGKKTNNSILIRKALTNKGVVLRQLAQYKEALVCFEEALEVNQVDGDLKSRAALLNNIGSVNTSLNYNETALGNYKEALAINTQLGDQEGIRNCYNNLGEVFLNMGNTIQALKNYQTSLDITIKEGDSAKLATSYVNIGRVHQTEEKYDKAISYFEKALKLMLDFDDPSLKAETFLHLGQTLMVNKHYNESKEYLQNATDIAESLNEKALLIQCYNSLSEWYGLNNLYKEALDYKTKYAELKDEITDEKAMLSSARMEAVYRLLKKEEQISILEHDNLLMDADLALARNTRTIYLGLAASLFIIVIILFLNYRIRRKTERLLKDKNLELKQLNATKDKFFSIIAHDLKSPFSSLMGFAEMLTLNAESKNTKEVVEYSNIIHNSTKRLLGLVENLLQWSRTQIGTTKYTPSKLDISIQTHNIVSLLRLNAEEKDIVISPKIARNLEAWADENLYNTILRNLISNAIKFSRVGSIIYVTAGIKNDCIEVSVADSGIGIRQENLEKLFMVDSAFTTKGTLNEKGTGLGLVLCKEFVEINKGTIWAESELEKGSTFYFTLPLYKTNETGTV